MKAPKKEEKLTMLPTITNTEFVNHLHEMTPTNDNQPAPQTAESKKLREHLLRATGKKITAEHYAHHLCNLIGYPLVHYPQHLTETLITNPHNPQQLKTPLEHTHHLATEPAARFFLNYAKEYYENTICSEEAAAKYHLTRLDTYRNHPLLSPNLPQHTVDAVRAYLTHPHTYRILKDSYTHAVNIYNYTHKKKRYTNTTHKTEYQPGTLDTHFLTTTDLNRILEPLTLTNSPHTHTWSLYEPYILNHPNALTTLLGNGTTKTFTTSTLHQALTQAKNEEQEAYQHAHENTRQAHAKHATLTEIFYTTQLPANTPALAVGTL